MCYYLAPVSTPFLGINICRSCITSSRLPAASLDSIKFTLLTMRTPITALLFSFAVSQISATTFKLEARDPRYKDCNNEQEEKIQAAATYVSSCSILNLDLMVRS